MGEDSLEFSTDYLRIPLILTLVFLWSNQLFWSIDDYHYRNLRNGPITSMLLTLSHGDGDWKHCCDLCTSATCPRWKFQGKIRTDPCLVQCKSEDKTDCLASLFCLSDSDWWGQFLRVTDNRVVSAPKCHDNFPSSLKVRAWSNCLSVCLSCSPSCTNPLLAWCDVWDS